MNYEELSKYQDELTKDFTPEERKLFDLLNNGIMQACVNIGTSFECSRESAKKTHIAALKVQVAIAESL